ncbi:MAG: hypothetical protein HYX53_12900 [Chloroflexi bacterium]|nr:hypothetical protein [Chloroflexota bacterium]
MDLGGDAQFQANQAKLNRCVDERLRAVRDAWSLQNAPSEAEVQSARDLLGACLRAAGVDVPEHPTSQELTAARQAYPAEFGPCSASVSDETGLKGFGG